MLSRDLQLVRLAAKGALELADLAAQLALAEALFLPGQRLPVGLEDLAPALIQGLRERVLTAEITDRPVTAHPLRGSNLPFTLRRVGIRG